MPVFFDRTTFQTSRAEEYFNCRKLEAMTGQSRDCFPSVVVKELMDNALDAAETAMTPPEIQMNIRRRGRWLLVAIRDNGPGISPETVRSILNFETRTSDKEAYRSPTRGRRGMP